MKLSYSLFSEYVRTKLRLEPRRGFRALAGGGEDDGDGADRQLSERERHHNALVHDNPDGRTR